MSERYTEMVRALVTPSLYRKIEQKADQQDLTISAHVRRILKLWHDPDAATVEACALVDSGVEYEVEEA